MRLIVIVLIVLYVVLAFFGARFVHSMGDVVLGSEQLRGELS